MAHSDEATTPERLAVGPVLVACAHGTRSAGGRATIDALVDEVASKLPSAVQRAYVDVQDPQIPEVVRDLPRRDGLAGVVVPVLLSSGYHVFHDIADAVATRADTVAAPPLGPDDRLVDIVLDRLREERVPDDATVVLAPAGSSDPRGIADAEATADRLRLRWGGPVRIGYAAGPEPSVKESVAAAREYGETVVAVASYLLAPGHFQDTLATAGADYVTGPLAPDPRLVSLIVERYTEAAAGRRVLASSAAGSNRNQVA